MKRVLTALTVALLLASGPAFAKESGEKGGTADINIGVGELQECTVSKSMDKQPSPVVAKRSYTAGRKKSELPAVQDKLSVKVWGDPHVKLAD